MLDWSCNCYASISDDVQCDAYLDCSDVNYTYGEVDGDGCCMCVNDAGAKAGAISYLVFEVIVAGLCVKLMILQNEAVDSKGEKSKKEALDDLKEDSEYKDWKHVKYGFMLLSFICLVAAIDRINNMISHFEDFDDCVGGDGVSEDNKLFKGRDKLAGALAMEIFTVLVALNSEFGCCSCD